MYKIFTGLLVMFGAMPALAENADDMNRVIDQGLNHSQVMQTAEHLMDVIGARMTNSPGMRQAEAWTQSQFKSWGLKNVHKEGFEFGRGWSVVSSSVRMTAPRPLQLTAIPVAWTPGTNGPITAPIVVAPMKRKRDFERWHGKLVGKIVLISPPDDGSEPGEAPFKRLTGDEIAKLDHYGQPVDMAQLDELLKRYAVVAKIDAFLKAEKAVAWARASRRDGKLLGGEGYTFRSGETPAVPGFEIAAEDYRRLARLAKVGPAPTLEVNSNVQFDDRDSKAYNIFAEIPGTDPGAGYVMAGAHLDSWAAGDGAADNGAGAVSVMEAARILSALGVRPRRTIRFALWAGEEQGLRGSQAYVEKYLATRSPPPASDSPDSITQYLHWQTRFPIKPQPGYKDLVAYFNIDNGSGKLRGLYAEGNVEATAMLRAWLQPFASLGAGAVVASSASFTDHQHMTEIGLAAFQFIQDPLDYDSRLHHTGIDTLDHLKAEDLRQASVVLAGVLFEAATSAKPLPRKPMPTQPTPVEPFKYADPADAD